MNTNQIAARAADKLSCPPRCSCAGSPYQKDGIRERKARARIIKSAIGKATEQLRERCLDFDAEYEKGYTAGWEACDNEAKISAAVASPATASESQDERLERQFRELETAAHRGVGQEKWTVEVSPFGHDSIKQGEEILFKCWPAEIIADAHNATLQPQSDVRCTCGYERLTYCPVHGKPSTEHSEALENLHTILGKKRAEIKRLKGRLASQSEDAKRLNWLEKQDGCKVENLPNDEFAAEQEVIFKFRYPIITNDGSETLREAIDAAMRKDK